MMLGLLMLACGYRNTSAQVAATTDDPFRFVSWILQDTKAIPRSLMMTSPVKMGISAVTLVTIAQFDETLSENAVDLRKRELMRILEEMGDANAIRPLSLVIFTGSLFTDNHRFQDAAFTSFQSLVYASLLTNALKLGFGRARPNETDEAYDFKPFSGKTSFPSGHATTAFAAITPWLLYYPHSVTVIALVVATGTAFSRIPLLYHWPSDVVAGALVGVATSSWLVRRHRPGSGSSNMAFQVAPGSVSLTYKW
ncbi:MAG: phosphatase PAP2 family protein [Bacteroidetes bacterium]|nr:phosphatase PAP2 family protein [Bacteroidota bacterium]